jgi:hypothetical protein
MILKILSQFANCLIGGFHIFQDFPNLPLHHPVSQEALEQIVLPHGRIADPGPDPPKGLFFPVRDIQ